MTSAATAAGASLRLPVTGQPSTPALERDPAPRAAPHPAPAPHRLPPPPPAPEELVVAADPLERLAQVEDFWRRNPGYVPLPVLPARLQGVPAALPLVRGVSEMFTPNEFGYGDPLVEQMRWQIRTGRQPQSQWWMAMNERLVGDAMTAEAYSASGRSRELTSPSQRAWLGYVELARHTREAAGLGPVPTDGTPTTPASAAPNPASRHEVAKLRSHTRHAYWVAHDESVKAAADVSNALLEEMARTSPREASFSSAWARSVEVYRYANPSAANHLTTIVNHSLLPQEFPVDSTVLTPRQRAVIAALEGAARLFPRRTPT